MWWNIFLSKKPCQQLLAFLSLLLPLCLRHLPGHLRGKSEEFVNSVTSNELTQSCSHRTNSENVAFNHGVWRWRSDLREGELISVRPSTINNFNGNGTEFGVLWKIIPHTSLKQMHLLLGRKRSRQWGYSSRTRFGWLHVPIILLSLGNTSKLGKHLFFFVIALSNNEWSLSFRFLMRQHGLVIGSVKVRIRSEKCGARGFFFFRDRQRVLSFTGLSFSLFEVSDFKSLAFRHRWATEIAT